MLIKTKLSAIFSEKLFLKIVLALKTKIIRNKRSDSDFFLKYKNKVYPDFKTNHL